ncbi:MAG: PAS domain S-box protein [Pseudohongiella sp.]|nr:PAS domain S-box protein [Pseudohongiella sp.]
MRVKSPIEKLLRKSKSGFNDLFEASVDGMLFVNFEGVIEATNKKLEEIFGYSREELIGVQIELLVPENSKSNHSKHRRKYKNQIDTPSRDMGELTGLKGLRKDGNEVDVEISLVPMGVGEERLILAIVRDVSDRLKLEAQLRQSQKMDALGKLAGGIAHDLNNILTVIQGYTELELIGNASTNSSLPHILSSTERATRLVDQLLSFTRQQAFKIRAANLNDIVSNMTKMLSPLIGESILLSQELDLALPNILVDSNQIEQVLMNLIVNARDAVGHGGEICIKTFSAELGEIPGVSSSSVKRATYAILSVKDTGTGIELEDLGQVFDPFFTTKEKGKGTGLGLSVVYGIVKQSHGYITVDSVEGEGATFTLYLPTTLDAVEEATESGETYRDTGSIRGSILIVDDEPDIRKLNRMFLDSLECDVVDVDCAEEAITLIEKSPSLFDLIISDIAMPGMDGTTLTNRVLLLSPTAKILLVSGAPVSNEQELLANERVSYLAKPDVVQLFFATQLSNFL